MKVESVREYSIKPLDKKYTVYKVVLTGGRDIYIQATDELDAWKQGEKFASKLINT